MKSNLIERQPLFCALIIKIAKKSNIITIKRVPHHISTVRNKKVVKQGQKTLKQDTCKFDNHTVSVASIIEMTLWF